MRKNVLRASAVAAAPLLVVVASALAVRLHFLRRCKGTG
jgi:hypothetical protein